VRFIRNTPDADAEMVGNKSTDVAGGKDLIAVILPLSVKRPMVMRSPPG